MCFLKIEGVDPVTLRTRERDAFLTRSDLLRKGTNTHTAARSGLPLVI